MNSRGCPTSSEIRYRYGAYRPSTPLPSPPLPSPPLNTNHGPDRTWLPSESGVLSWDDCPTAYSTDEMTWTRHSYPGLSPLLGWFLGDRLADWAVTYLMEERGSLGQVCVVLRNELACDEVVGFQEGGGWDFHALDGSRDGWIVGWGWDRMGWDGMGHSGGRLG
jgi:hypothetical protein